MYNQRPKTVEEAKALAAKLEAEKREKRANEKPLWELKYNTTLTDIRAGNYYNLTKNCEELCEELDANSELCDDLAERATLFGTVLSNLLACSHKIIGEQLPSRAHLIIHREILNAGVESYTAIMKPMIEKYGKGPASAAWRLMLASPLYCEDLLDYHESLKYNIALNVLSLAEDVPFEHSDSLIVRLYAEIGIVSEKMGEESAELIMMLPNADKRNDIVSAFVNYIGSYCYTGKSIYLLGYLMKWVRGDAPIIGKILHRIRHQMWVDNGEKEEPEPVIYEDTIAFFMDEVSVNGSNMRYYQEFIAALKKRGYRIELYHSQRYLVSKPFINIIDKFIELPEDFNKFKLEDFLKNSWRLAITCVSSPWWSCVNFFDMANYTISFVEDVEADWHLTAEWDSSEHENPVAIHGMGKMISCLVPNSGPAVAKSDEKNLHICLPWTFEMVNAENITLLAKIVSAVRACKKFPVFFMPAYGKIPFTRYYAKLDELDAPDIILIKTLGEYYGVLQTFDYYLALPYTPAAYLLDGIFFEKHMLTLNVVDEDVEYRHKYPTKLAELCGIPTYSEMELLEQFKKPKRDAYTKLVESIEKIDVIAVEHNQKLSDAFWNFCAKNCELEVRKFETDVDVNLREMREELPEI